MTPMLPDVVRETQVELDKYEVALTQQNQIQHIQDTLSELIAIQKQCSRVIVAYDLLKPHLGSVEQEAIFNSIEGIHSRLNNSRTDFIDGTYRQAQMLGNIKHLVNSLHSNMEKLWMLYVQDKIRPFDELTRIAKTLPQMRQYTSQLDTLITELNITAKSLPNVRIWGDFHAKLNQVASLLKDIEGLSREKRDFLNIVLSGQASLHHITPEILEWCAEVGLSNSLILRFRNDT